MDALRALRVRSGLSYRDVALRMSQVAPRHAMAKSTLAALFAQDALPRRPGQLTAIVDVLTAELTEPADVFARYLEAWTRLMTDRSARPGTPTGPQQASPPCFRRLPWRRRRAAATTLHRLHSQTAYRESSGPCTTPDQAKSDFEKAGGLRPLLAGAPCSRHHMAPVRGRPTAVLGGLAGVVRACTPLHFNRRPIRSATWVQFS